MGSNPSSSGHESRLEAKMRRSVASRERSIAFIPAGGGPSSNRTRIASSSSFSARR
ncbi:MAG TPA: hypothetical protein VGH14_21965 [Solirubrobacterales bacterium]